MCAYILHSRLSTSTHYSAFTQICVYTYYTADSSHTHKYFHVYDMEKLVVPYIHACIDSLHTHYDMSLSLHTHTQWLMTHTHYGITHTHTMTRLPLHTHTQWLMTHTHYDMTHTHTMTCLSRHTHTQCLTTNTLYGNTHTHTHTLWLITHTHYASWSHTHYDMSLSSMWERRIPLTHTPFIWCGYD